MQFSFAHILIGTTERQAISLMSILGERACVSVDITEVACKDFTIRVSSDDESICIPNDSTSITIDTSTTRCGKLYCELCNL